MPDGLHSHDFRGVTTYTNGHVHRYTGTTSAAPNVPGHTHFMAGETSVSDGHTHRYGLYTGPDIQADGGHTHQYQGATALNDRHVHYLYGYTTTYGG